MQYTFFSVLSLVILGEMESDDWFIGGAFFDLLEVMSGDRQ